MIFNIPILLLIHLRIVMELSVPPKELNPDIIERLKNPPQYTPTLNADKHLSIDLFLSVSNASEETYNSVRTAVMRRHPDDDILSYYQVKKLVAELSGVS
ncbi:hypothetical protein B0H10DRAFT_2213999 [Mycena sp. CBHHK59/15]|nr:hypothetical protein B0H10DRAFT_2213999 [Mycena sp. CBHHK59/15]